MKKTLLTSLALMCAGAASTCGAAAEEAPAQSAASPASQQAQPSEATELALAVAEGNAAEVHRLILNGADIHAPGLAGDGTMPGYTLLHSAAERLHTKVVHELLNAGADALAKDARSHCTPRELMERALADAPADVRTRVTRTMGYALQCAEELAAPAPTSDPAADPLWLKARALLENRASEAEWDALEREVWQRTQGHALEQPISRFMRVIRQYKHDPVVVLMAALDTQCGDVEWALSKCTQPLLNRAYRAPAYEGLSPLFLAVAQHRFSESQGMTAAPYESTFSAYHVRMTRRLLEQGADPNLPSGRYLMSPLMAAARAGNTESVKMLLAAGAAVNQADATGATALSWAVEGGHAEAVRCLLDAGAAVNHVAAAAGKYAEPTEDAYTPLHLAAAMLRADIVQMLLEAGADARATDMHGLTLADLVNSTLFESTYFGRFDVREARRKVSELLERGAAEPAAPHREQPGPVRTPLMEAAYRGDAEAVRNMLAAGCNVDERDADKCTALSWAVAGGHADVVNILLQAGASLSARGADERHRAQAAGFSVLHSAVAERLSDVVAALLQAGAYTRSCDALGQYPSAWADAPVRRLRPPCDWAAPADQDAWQAVCKALKRAEQMPGDSDIFFAVRDGADAATVHDLLERGGDAQRIFLEMLYFEKGDVTQLLEAGADADAIIFDSNARYSYITPLYLAAAEHSFGECEGTRGHSRCTATPYNAPMVKRLLELGADPNTPSVQSLLRTPLMAAAAAGNLEVVQLLLSAGARINQADFSGATALSYAVTGGHTKVARFLLDSGATLHCAGTDSCGEAEGRRLSLLHVAAARKDADMVQLLLEYRADPDAQDVHGNRPKDLVSIRLYSKDHTTPEQPQRVTTLLIHPPTPAAALPEPALPQRTPLMDAAYAGNTDTVKSLLAAGSDVNERDADGCTALSWAVAAGNEHVVQLLLAHGAEVGVRAADPLFRAQALRMSVLHHAIALRLPAIAEALLKAGADPTARDAFGKTPDDWKNSRVWLPRANDR